MGRTPSGITWFDEDECIGTGVTFVGLGGLVSSTWRLDRKIIESEYYESERGVTSGCSFSEARAVFFCSRKEAYLYEAVIKIRMQYAPFSEALGTSRCLTIIIEYHGGEPRQNPPM